MFLLELEANFSKRVCTDFLGPAFFLIHFLKSHIWKYCDILGVQLARLEIIMNKKNHYQFIKIFGVKRKGTTL